MNTIVHIPYTNEEQRLETDLRQYLGVAYMFNPGSLHSNGEIYSFKQGNLFRIVYTQDDEAIPVNSNKIDSYEFEGGYLTAFESLDSTDILLPRALDTELSQLARFWRVYLIRVPAIGLGSNHLVIGGNQVPITAPNVIRGLRPPTRPLEQKHVLKPSKH